MQKSLKSARTSVAKFQSKTRKKVIKGFRSKPPLPIVVLDVDQVVDPHQLGSLGGRPPGPFYWIKKAIRARDGDADVGQLRTFLQYLNMQVAQHGSVAAWSHARRG